MKRFFLFLIIAVALASCATSRKVQESTSATVVETSSVQESEKHETVTTIDTTRTEHGKVIITEIVFETTGATVGTTDARASPADGEEEAPVETVNPSGNPAVVLDLVNIGKISGNVKSIRQTILEADIEQKGVVEQDTKQEQSKSNANAVFAEETTDKSSAPAPDPYRWRYIFYIACVAVVALLYIKRAPIINWIKRILAGLRRIF